MCQEQAEKFEQAVTEHLEPHRDELVASLRRLIEHKYVPEVARLHFEVYCDQFHESFPVSFFYLDATGDEYGDEGASWPDLGELVESEGVLDVEFLEHEEFDGLDTMTAAGKALIAWFADCWQVAGGRSYPLKATIRLHGAEIYDAGRYYNLMRAEWDLPRPD